MGINLFDKRKWTVKKIVIAGLEGVYRCIIRPSMQGRCRFFPSCFDYSKEALMQKNICGAFYLIVKRLLRCHPWGKYGYDPVPLSPPSKSLRDLCKNKKIY